MALDYLEEGLAELSRATRYPPTPDLAAGFVRRLEPAPPSGGRPSRLALAWVSLSAAVVAAAVLAGTAAPVREAGADLFDRINIFSTSQPLAGLPAEVTGREATVDEAEDALGRPIEQPAYPPGATLERVIVQDFGMVRAAVLDYNVPGAWPFALFVTDARVGKGIAVDSGISAQNVVVPGSRQAYWFGGPHRVEYRGYDGKVIAESVRRTSDQALAWERGGFVYRLEGQFGLAEAVRIAESLAPAGE